MQNAAIYLHPEAFDTTSGRLLGRHAAGESFLRGLLAHADVDEFVFWNVRGDPEPDLRRLIGSIGAVARPLRWIAAQDRQALSEPGVLNIPTPELPREAWHRRVLGSHLYSICGLTHTTATERVMTVLANLLIAPVEGHDALICTSRAVRASVETQLEGVRDYLAAEFGPRRRAEPQRATIPLGVNSDDYAVTPAQRHEWRERLGIPDDAPVALYVGRFNIREKMNPGLMAVALERSAVATGKAIYWVNSGWAETEEAGEIYHREAQALCPSVRYIAIDGRDPEVRFSIWSVADFFISFSDNIQETFGLTPIEAMAAGLPCVVTDWNGYKDTVRHGEDGFRIPTVAPGPGGGGDLAFQFSNGRLHYTNYVGATAQYVAIDYAEAVAAISILVTNADYRRQLGENARRRAREVFDWRAIVPQYQALWAELDARRRASDPSAPAENPFRPDPYRLFGAYPSRYIGPNDRLSFPVGGSPAAARDLLAGPLAVYSGLNRPTPEQVDRVLLWLDARQEGTVDELMQEFPPQLRPYMRRGLLWIARLGAIDIRPPGKD